MISLELSTIQAKNAERAQISDACERFLRAGGRIERVAGFEVRQLVPHAWNRNDMALPGSSQNTHGQNLDAALAKRIAEIIAQGGGISSMKVTLRVDAARIKRVAKEYGIEIPKIRAATTLSGRAIQAMNDSRAAGRESKLPIVISLAATGKTIDAMAEAADVSRNTIMRWLKQYSIQRGPKMDLSV